MSEKTGLESLGCMAQLFIAALSLVASISIAFWQIESADEQATRANASQIEIAQKQEALTIQLDEIDQWRKQPQLIVLNRFQVRRDTVNCIVQNTGGRDLVFFSVDLEVTTPLTEIKGDQPAVITRPVIETADRSKVHMVDLAMQDLERNNAFVLDPPVIVKPGESLTLRFIFPTPSNRYIVQTTTNVDRHYLFHFEPPRSLDK